ncbi:MAG: pilus assembly protein PilM [Planctomycetes bacterium]|nr:pilus assembly protein PilM [Planctomycetota bacterium]
MARATGVQITGTAVRVVDIEGSPKKFKVRGFAEVAIVDDESDPDGALTKAMREAFKAAKASKEHVILGVPVRDCIIREITIPFTDPDQIRKVIKFESESHLHSCSIDDVVVCFHKVAESGNRSTLLVIAARKELIARILLALEKVGVDPLAVDIDAAGLFGIATELDETAERGDYVVCDIGYTATMITLVKDGELRIVRSVRMGTDSITARVSQDLDIDRAEARTRTQAILQQDLRLADDLMVRSGDVVHDDDEVGKTSSELERDIIRQRQAELIVRLKQEILRSINPAKLTEPPKCIYLLGPGSNLPRINADLAEAFGVPVKSLNVLDEVDHHFSSDEVPVMNAALPIATGLALKHLGHDPLNLDFRQEEFVFARRFDRLKIPFICMIFLFTVLNAFCWFYLRTIEAHENNKLKAAAERAGDIFDKAIGKGLKEGQKRYMPFDEAEMSRKFRGADNSKAPYKRITYVGKTLKEVHDELRKTYNLGGSEADKGTTVRRRSGTSGSNVSFASALEQWETVFSCFERIKLKEFSIDSLKATPKEVAFGLTIPENAEIGGRLVGYQEIYSLFRDQLVALPPEQGFKEIEVRGGQRQSETREGFVYYPQIVVQFNRE